jgi:hypothetical protein
MAANQGRIEVTVEDRRIMLGDTGIMLELLFGNERQLSRTKMSASIPLKVLPLFGP